MTNLHQFPVQFKGSKFALWVLNLLGWSMHFNGLPARHGVIVFYPHTSNWDFCIGIIAKWAMGIELNFLAKDSLFKVPLLGTWMRYLGGRPVVRKSPQGYVENLVKEMGQSSYFWVVITPEGTRKYSPGWKSGFYRLAHQAQVPVGLAFIDYSKKEIGVTEFINLSGDEDMDLEIFKERYRHRMGFHRNKMAPITMLNPVQSKEKSFKNKG